MIDEIGAWDKIAAKCYNFSMFLGQIWSLFLLLKIKELHICKNTNDVAPSGIENELIRWSVAKQYFKAHNIYSHVPYSVNFLQTGESSRQDWGSWPST